MIESTAFKAFELWWDEQSRKTRQLPKKEDATQPLQVTNNNNNNNVMACLPWQSALAVGMVGEFRDFTSTLFDTAWPLLIFKIVELLKIFKLYQDSIAICMYKIVLFLDKLRTFYSMV